MLTLYIYIDFIMKLSECGRYCTKSVACYQEIRQKYILRMWINSFTKRFVIYTKTSMITEFL